MLTKEEMMSRLAEIGTCEDDVTRRTLLTSITDEVSSVYDANENLTATNTQYETDNQNLRDANMQLFLRVTSGQANSPLDNNGNEPEPKKRSYTDLFNEKGELK